MKSATLKLNFDFVPVVTKDASNECFIEGYANTVTKDRVADVVLPAAFEKSLPTYLDNPVLLANHDWNDVIGVVTAAKITDKGLYIRARISDTRPDIKTLVREGCLRTFSIGYNELDADFDEATKTKIIKNLELLEISVVSVPANPEAKFQVVQSQPAAEQEAQAAEKFAIHLMNTFDLIGEAAAQVITKGIVADKPKTPAATTAKSEPQTEVEPDLEEIDLELKLIEAEIAALEENN